MLLKVGSAFTCVPKIMNCQVPFEDQPQKLTTEGKCPTCMTGYALKDDGTCKACNESISNCVTCPTLSRCNKCKDDYFPNLHQTKCMLPFDLCQDDPENYGNDGTDYVCNNCPYEHYWSSTSRSCVQCPI